MLMRECIPQCCYDSPPGFILVSRGESVATLHLQSNPGEEHSFILHFANTTIRFYYLSMALPTTNGGPAVLYNRRRVFVVTGRHKSISNTEKKTWVIRGKKIEERGKNRKRRSVAQRKNVKRKRKRREDKYSALSGMENLTKLNTFRYAFASHLVIQQA